MPNISTSQGKGGNTVVFSLRIGETTYEQVRELSLEEDRSINTQILRFIRDGLRRESVQAIPGN